MMRELKVPARLQELERVTAFVEEMLEQHECPVKTQMQITIAVEEIFVNIASYAYSPGEGEACITLSFSENPAQVRITFTDKGRAFNPLEKADPDVSLSAEERKIGGLGIYMVKKSMDEVAYEYRNGCNILMIQKKW